MTHIALGAVVSLAVVAVWCGHGLRLAICACLR